MSLNHLTQYPFSNEHGVTGTLAADPTFGKTVEGKGYAKLAVYCKAVDDDNKKSRRSKLSDARELPLIAYVNVFNKELLSDVGTLKKGYFVNFSYDKLTVTLGEHEENDRLRANVLFVANHLEVRYKPETKKATHSNRKSDHDGDTMRSRQKK